MLEKENEPDQAQARRLQDAVLADRVAIKLPALWRYEVGNVLGLKQPALAMELMNALLAYDFEEVLLETAYALAVLDHIREMKEVTFYDSAYHVLAMRTKGLYLTADAAYVKRAKRKGFIALLSAWDGPPSRK